MTVQTVSVPLPRPVVRKLERAAALTHRSVMDILTSVVNATFPDTPGLPEALADELAAFQMLSDDALWAAAQPSLAPTEQVRLSQLNETANARPLTPPEMAEQTELLAAYQRSVLRRAKALAILAQRGHPLPDEPPFNATER